MRLGPLTVCQLGDWAGPIILYLPRRGRTPFPLPQNFVLPVSCSRLWTHSSPIFVEPFPTNAKEAHCKFSFGNPHRGALQEKHGRRKPRVGAAQPAVPTSLHPSPRGLWWSRQQGLSTPHGADRSVLTGATPLWANFPGGQLTRALQFARRRPQRLRTPGCSINRPCLPSLELPSPPQTRSLPAVCTIAALTALDKMSTPTTATATLPHYRRHHYPYQAGGATATTYRTNGLPPPHPSTTTTNQLLLSPSSSSTRLPPAASFQAPPAQYSPTSLTADSRTLPVPNTTNGLTPSSTSASSRAPYGLATLPPDTANYQTMSSSNPAPRTQRPRRQRSREPDWNSFYKNGLPDEIIVIDDTPEPEAAGPSTAGQPSHHIISGGANAYGNGAATAAASMPRPAAKKRKRDGDFDSGYYTQKYGTSVASTPHHNDSVSGSISTDRNTAQTAAATSLSSGSQYDYDVQLGNKRKRTRQQVANEAKRREVDLLGDAYISYKPPPLPPKKASDVPVRTVHDVSPLHWPNLTGSLYTHKSANHRLSARIRQERQGRRFRWPLHRDARRQPHRQMYDNLTTSSNFFFFLTPANIVLF